MTETMGPEIMDANDPAVDWSDPYFAWYPWRWPDDERAWEEQTARWEEEQRLQLAAVHVPEIEVDTPGTLLEKLIAAGEALDAAIMTYAKTRVAYDAVRTPPAAAGRGSRAG